MCALPAAEVSDPSPSPGLSKALYMLHIAILLPPCPQPVSLFCHQISSLKNRLKKVSTTTGDGVARAFLKAQAAFFGSYRNALKIEPVSSFLACHKSMFGKGHKKLASHLLLNSPKEVLCVCVWWGLEKCAPLTLPLSTRKLRCPEWRTVCSCGC